MGITVNALNGLAVGEWLSENLGKGNGTFTARRTAEGVIFYFRYTKPDGKRDTYRFASYDKNGGNGGLTLKEARDLASDLSKEYKAHPNLRDYLDEKQQQEVERVNRERRERQVATLESLLNGYITYLEQRGKDRTAKDVRGIFRRRVFVPFPELAKMKAASITIQNLNKVVAAVVASGAGREAAKLRSYMSAAFSAAIRAESDPDIPPFLHDFNLTANPAASLAPLSKYNRAREVTLSKEELKAYWQKLQAIPGVTGAALRLSVLLGGQRLFQLLRLQRKDVNLAEGQITLFDSKGKRAEPRRHVLPLPDAARVELEPYLEVNAPFLLSSTQGKVPLNVKTLSNKVIKIAKEMVTEGTRTEPFQLRDIRRTIETFLASQGVSMEVRAQLQSHGLSGVQARHYDMHKYMDEKLAAMERIIRLITEESAKIISIRAAM